MGIGSKAVGKDSPYCPTALLPYCPTALLPYCPTALLPPHCCASTHCDRLSRNRHTETGPRVLEIAVR
ncbi:hypothetical protein FJ934_26690 [Mesorhizobium sp. B2-4-12]|nr:hypothetical protein FJ934_26690 [Mesorhizobium sp. B2-4-12]TPK99451.1 hypothetical protein FJ938_23970 [Mesorhizobium sp. B2-4-14]